MKSYKKIRFPLIFPPLFLVYSDLYLSAVQRDGTGTRGDAGIFYREL